MYPSGRVPARWVMATKEGKQGLCSDRRYPCRRCGGRGSVREVSKKAGVLVAPEPEGRL